MAKRNISAELTAYFKGNIDDRIKGLKEEITALTAIRMMFASRGVPKATATVTARKKSVKKKKPLHWTKRPENGHKLKSLLKKMQAAKKEKAANG